MSSMRVSPLLASYPRPRPKLPEGSHVAFEQAYFQSRNGIGLLYGLTQHLEAWMHRRIASEAAHSGSILEIGAGALNHLPWEHDWEVYDVVEPRAELYENQRAAARVNAFFADIAEVPREPTYDRVISIATLEHVVDLPSLLAEAGLRLRPGGQFLAGIPSEGGLLWGLAWRLSVGISFRIRTGWSYGDLMRHEHVNRAEEIIALVRHFFRSVRVRRFPAPWHHASLYTALVCRNPDLDRCRNHLQCQMTPGR